MIDFSLPDEWVQLRDRVEAFVRDEVVPRERDPRQDGHGPSDALRRNSSALRARRDCCRRMRPSSTADSGSTIAAGDRLRGGRLQLARAAGASTSRRPTKATATCFTRSATRGTEGALAASAGGWRDPQRIHNDRAGRWRRRRPLAAQDHARADGDGLRDQRTQVAHHRRARRLAEHRHGTDLRPRRQQNRRQYVPGRYRRARVSQSCGSSTPSTPCRPAATPRSSSTMCGCQPARCSANSGTGSATRRCGSAPARLTHCMRWLGAARRAHDIAVDYARRRHAFGRLIGEHQGVGFMLADNEMDMRDLAVWRSGTRPGYLTRANAHRWRPAAARCTALRR